MDEDKTQRLDCADDASSDETQILDAVSATSKTQSLDGVAPSDTASFDAVSDKTQSIDIAGLSREQKCGTREFPAVVADDSQAKDMTVMLAGEYAAAMGMENRDTNADPERDNAESLEILEGPAFVPTGKTEVLPFTRKYFEQYETDEGIPDDALEPQTDEPLSECASDAPAKRHIPAHSKATDLRKRRRRIVVAVLVACIAIAALVAAMAWIAHTEHEKALRPHSVLLEISAPEYGAADSKFPIHIEGADMDGTVVDEVQYVDVNGRGIELVRGDYALSVAASPLMDGARIYRVPDTRLRVEMGDDIEPDAEYAPENARFEFEFAYLVDVTDDDIDASYTHALKSGFDENKARAYRDALVEKRDAELAAQRAEEEKARRMADTQNALTSFARSKGETGISSKLVDIDEDGFPELLLAGNANSSIGAMGFVYAYDAQSHRVVEIASAAGGSNHAPSIWYSSSMHEVVLTTQSSTRETYTFYAVNGVSARIAHTYVHEVTRVSSAPSASSSSSSGVQESSSASSSSSSAAQAPESSSSVVTTKDVFTCDGQPISLESYNEMIYSLGNSYYAISAPQ